MIFYKLAFDPRYKRIENSADTMWEKIVCPKYDDHQRTGNRIGNLIFNVKDNINREFFWTYTSELVVSEYMLDILTQNEITGFNAISARVNNKLTDIEFFELSPANNAGMADNIELRGKCEYCGFEYYAEKNQPKDQSYLSLTSVLVDPKKWNGNDIFNLIGLPRVILITERLKELLVNNRLKGAMVVRSDDFSRIVYP